MNWISLKDKYPDEHIRVLVTNGKLIWVAVFRPQDNTFTHWLNEFEGQADSITHWIHFRDIPKP